jgi:hypothetical protein
MSNSDYTNNDENYNNNNEAEEVDDHTILHVCLCLCSLYLLFVQQLHRTLKMSASTALPNILNNIVNPGNDNGAGVVNGSNPHTADYEPIFVQTWAAQLLAGFCTILAVIITSHQVCLSFVVN